MEKDGVTFQWDKILAYKIFPSFNSNLITCNTIELKKNKDLPYLF